MYSCWNVVKQNCSNLIFFIFWTSSPWNEFFISRGVLANESYRFSAFWLRSSVVSVLISLIADRLAICQPFRSNVFLCLGERLEACFTLSTDCPGIALLPGVVHFPFSGMAIFKTTKKERLKTKNLLYRWKSDLDLGLAIIPAWMSAS